MFTGIILPCIIKVLICFFRSTYYEKQSSDFLIMEKAIIKKTLFLHKLSVKGVCSLKAFTLFYVFFSGDRLQTMPYCLFRVLFLKNNGILSWIRS